MYEGPSVEIPLDVMARASMGLPVDPRELDLLYGLHRFALLTNVVAAVASVPRSTTYQVRFTSWRTKMRDHYDFDPRRHIPVPNPDHGQQFSNAIAPGERTIVVYHKHAIRVERAGLATPFDVESEEWQVNDATISASAVVDVSRCWSARGVVECR